MNTANTTVPNQQSQQIRPTQKSTLPEPPKNESPLDRAIRLAGVTPIGQAEVKRHKRETLIKEKLRMNVTSPLRGDVQEGMSTGLEIALVLSILAFLWGLSTGLVTSISYGTMVMGPFCIPPAIAIGLSLYLGSVAFEDSIPYWVSASFTKYERRFAGTPLPRNVWDIFDEVRLRYPRARFGVDYITYSSDPILWVSTGRFLGRRRYLAIWG